MSTVYITGATGFIGGHLVRANLAAGNAVRALTLAGDPGAEDLRRAGVEVAIGDIRDAAAVAKSMAGADIVYHCAAVVTDWAPKKLFAEVTVGGTENVCRAALAAGVKRLVKLSTNDVFGLDESTVLTEESPLSPWHEPYPDFKIQAEEVAWRYYREKGLPVTMVYPCWVFGPGDRTFVPLLADAILNNEMIFWRKDVLVWPAYIDNLADLLARIAVDDRAVGHGYLVHDGESTTLQAFCAAIAEALGTRPPNRHIPYAAAYAAAAVMEALWKLTGRTSRPLLTTYTVKNLGSRLRFSINKAARELDWRPPVSYPEGLRRTLEWLLTLDRKTLKNK
jgi:nucleoside-diphosphate-sugar epimerase